MTKEMSEKLQKAAGAEELMTLAKENGVTLEAAEAQKLFDALQASKTGELSEEDLAQASGGIWLFANKSATCPQCGKSNKVKWVDKKEGAFYCKRCDLYFDN